MSRLSCRFSSYVIGRQSSSSLSSMSNIVSGGRIGCACCSPLFLLPPPTGSSGSRIEPAQLGKFDQRLLKTAFASIQRLLEFTASTFMADL